MCGLVLKVFSSNHSHCPHLCSVYLVFSLGSDWLSLHSKFDPEDPFS